jgi:S1-C subfamily serine protease
MHGWQTGRVWLAGSIALGTAFWGVAALAQDQRWVQIEAHRDLETALGAAQSYDATIVGISAFQLPSNWIAISVGPFETDTEAFAARRQLRADGFIPADAFISNGANYLAQVFPITADGLPVETPVVTAQDSAPVLDAGAAPVAEPEPVAVAVAEPQPEPEPEPEPEPTLAPEPEPEPEETLREAQNSERTLTRDDRAAIQTALAWFGFYAQRIDAAFGPGTRRSMQDWQAANDFETTGVLTTRQRAQLLAAYQGELDALGMQIVRDEASGIELELPMAMVEFDRYEAPFVHFRAKDGSGVQVLLLSQAGNQATLFGLYEIMQSLDIIPLEGPRERRQNGFLLTGSNDTMRAHSVANLRNGQIKGFTIIWPAERDGQIARILPAIESSLSSFGATLPDSAGQASTVGRGALLAGLTLRRPAFSRTGFYIDATGTVLTSADAVAQCGRVTLDEAYDARIVAQDEALNLAVLKPETPLVPLAFAQFGQDAANLGSSVTIAGFSFEDVLTRPVLTFGRIEDLSGLNGETDRIRLSATVRQGDFGGAVFGPNGAVVGLLTGQPVDPSRQLPPEVTFATPAGAIRAFLSANNISSGTLRSDITMPAETMTRVAADLSVLVSCWK